MLNEKRLLVGFGLVLVVFIISFFAWANSAPRDFPIKTYIEVSQGSSAKSVVTMLQKQHVVRSVDFTLLVGKVLGSTNSLVAGTYQFDKPLTAIHCFSVPFRRR